MRMGKGKRPSKAKDPRAGSAATAHIAKPCHSGRPRDVAPRRTKEVNTAINAGRGTRGDGVTSRTPRR